MTNNSDIEVTKSTKKRISFFSIVLIIIGSSIGAGIFFQSGKVLDYSGNNLIWAIFSWCIAAFAVLAMALALIEISSATLGNNLGIIGWCKKFNKKIIYQACKYFMTYAYIPLTYFFLPIYAILTFQDGLSGFDVSNNFNTANDWVIWMFVVIILSVWFIFSAGLSARFGNAQNTVITGMKFIPLVGAVVIGLVIVGVTKSVQNVDLASTQWTVSPSPVSAAADGALVNADKNQWSFFTMTPLVGVWGAMAAIFFAFDGFYVTAGIQTEMKNPKKLPLAFVLGLAIITAIYLTIAISMSISTSGGSFFQYLDFLKGRDAAWVFGVMNILIAFGILGIINGFSLWAPRFMVDLFNTDELHIPRHLRKFLKKDRPWAGVLYTTYLTVPIIIIFSIIGGLGYFANDAYLDGGASLYDGAGFYSMARLVSFADLLAVWTTIFAFAFIVFAIAGGLKNRRTNKIAVQKNKHFVWAAIASIILIGLSLLFTVLQPFADTMIYLARYSSLPESFINDNGIKDKLIGSFLLIVVLFIYLTVTFVPIYFENRWKRRQAAQAKINSVNKF